MRLIQCSKSAIREIVRVKYCGTLQTHKTNSIYLKCNTVKYSSNRCNMINIENYSIQYIKNVLWYSKLLGWNKKGFFRNLRNKYHYSRGALKTALFLWNNQALSRVPATRYLLKGWYSQYVLKRSQSDIC